MAYLLNPDFSPADRVRLLTQRSVGGGHLWVESASLFMHFAELLRLNELQSILIYKAGPTKGARSVLTARPVWDVFVRRVVTVLTPMVSELVEQS